MELDKELKETMIQSCRDYLTTKKVPYRFITIRNGTPVVIVDDSTFYSILDRNLEGDCIEGRFLAQGENGWSAYVKEDSHSRFKLKDNMTEYQASCFIQGIEYGRKPKTTRFAMGGIS